MEILDVCYNELFVCQIEVLPNCMKKVLYKMQFTVWSRVEKRTTTAVNCGFFTRKNGRFALPIMPLGKHKRVSQVCQPLCQIGTLQDGFGFWVSKNTLLLSHKKTQLWKKLGSSMKKYFHCHRQIIATITPYSAFYLWMTCLKDLKLIDGGLVFFFQNHIFV